ncbi:MAG: hypothetical protein EOP84_28915 [Verrucomicrobiaceae bacterium]|nr:MAG: hypothetical protein EOP84_28915 [Verrucomicrobiaceae bacterium]
MDKSRFTFGVCVVLLGCAVKVASVVSTPKPEPVQVVKEKGAAEPFCSECKTPTGRSGLLTAKPVQAPPAVPADTTGSR